MKISDRTGRVLHALQFRRDTPIDEIARVLKVKAHLIRYDLARLTLEGIIKPGIVIDHHKLGVQQFQFYISLGFDSAQKQKKRALRI